MLRKLTILGGSSPFTAALFEALVSHAPPLAPMEIMLHGRDARALAIVAEFARRRLARLGWTARFTLSLAEALDGSAVVIHQVRYGGLEGRADAERLCADVGIPADETLGPAALLIGMRSVDPCQALAQTVARYCPGAWFLNLTNPLSTMTSILHDSGGAKFAGLCELPEVTARMLATAAEIPYADLEWQYTGLNHRGFLHHLRYRGRDIFADLLEDPARAAKTGFFAETIRELGSVPLKYFQLVLCRNYRAEPSRAAALIRLRSQLLDELAQSDQAPPPSLSARYMDWYPYAVAPCLAALQSVELRNLVLNLPSEDGLVREYRVRMNATAIEPNDTQPPPESAARWLARFERHERAVLDAFRDPSPANTEYALAVDPLVPIERVPDVAEKVWERFQSLRTEDLAYECR